MKFSITNDQVQKNIAALQAFMKEQNIESFYVSSFDPFLNEYVPMEDCHRFYVTGFTGSVAEALVPVEGKVKLYVDGRYHEQADNQCDLNLIEVVKVPANKGLLASLKEDLKTLNPANIAIEGNRTSLSFFEYLDKELTVKTFLNNELHQVIDFAKMPALKPVKHLPKELRGSDTSDKLKRIFNTTTNQAYFVTAIDSLAWITNCRGYHLPNLSSFLGRALVTASKVFVFVDEEVSVECSDSSIEFFNIKNSEIKNKLNEIVANLTLDNIFIDKQMLNTQDFLMLKDVFGEDKLTSKPGGLIEFHAIKEQAEIEVMKESFKRADKAIYNTILWVKEQVKAGNKISEFDLYEQTTKEYQKQGAVEQSFGTIAGVGPNGSIIHYGDPKKDVIINEDDMVLLDSGGYFEAGFATDTTRTFMASTKEGSAKHKKIYTLVLKGTLALQNAVFKSGTRGNGLDAICRQPLYQAGFDFAHGTGHGVGIHVHEGGAGIGPTRTYEMKAGQVVSIEPGIYIPGFGGVRLENIALVVDHPQYEGFLKFESLVKIGFEPTLIDESMLTEQEKVWLEEYEAECVKAGTSFLV